MRTTRNKGFTLIEMIVAVGIFSVVMTISTGAIFSMVNASRSAHAIKSVLDNLNGALDTMSRTIRFGSLYHCETLPSFHTVPGSNGVAINQRNACPTEGGNALVFEGHNGTASTEDQIVYKFIKDPTIGGAPSTGALWRCNGFNTLNCVRLTAPEVYIENFQFFVQDAGSGSAQPRVLMLIKGFALAGTQRQSFQLQTMISQRDLDAIL